MNDFFEHNNILKLHFDYVVSDSSELAIKEAICLDSIDSVLRKCLNIDEMKEVGSFFTGQRLATKLVSKFLDDIDDNSVILDPTCGAGNLLIECSRHLSVMSSLKLTLNRWGHALRGYDIRESFVEATKLRLILEAINRGAKKDCSLEEAINYFNFVKVCSVMDLHEEDVIGVTHAIMNPPFATWDSPKRDFWRNGKVNSAGIVFEHVLKILPASTNISSILPDVLRSGSRYCYWRDFISNNMTAKSEIHGRFSVNTDVDVFILYGLVRRKNSDEIQWFETFQNEKKLSDEYDVCIGPLVAYRDRQEGDLFPFIHPKTAPAWSKVEKFVEFRRYFGKVFKPPLVVIRRTSSPTDRFRAIGCIIDGVSSVAIENHMIVVVPKDGSLHKCQKLLELLKSENVNIFLNERIRLRHLTVEVIKNIPIS